MFSENDVPVLAILRNVEEKDIAPLAEIFRNNGVKYAELTLNTPDAIELMKALMKEGKDDLIVGAGTVLNEKDMHEALENGAKFIVCPSTKEEIVRYCSDEAIPVFPGALTPTEVHKAWDYGASMVKVFPAGAYGPGYLKALKGPFDKIKFMAVGGINENNVSKYLHNGADAVAFGAGILRPFWLTENKYDIIGEKVRQFVMNCSAGE